MTRISVFLPFLLFSLLTGCASSPGTSYSICSTQPGTYACQVDLYERAND